MFDILTNTNTQNIFNSHFVNYDIIKYNTDEEYQQLICSLFVFSPDKFIVTKNKNINNDTNSVNSDNNSNNENLIMYDDDQLQLCLDYLYDITKNNTYFLNLYIAAAKQFLSNDPSIGQITLCSFDYFFDYIIACREFITKVEFSSQSLSLFNTTFK